MKETKTIQIEVPAGKQVEWQVIEGKTVLVMVDEKPKEPKRIKTFEEACKKLGDNHPYVLKYRKMCENAEYVYLNNRSGESLLDDMLGKDVVAYMKLRIITEALNDTWHPNYTKREAHYSPWFQLYTKKRFYELNHQKDESRLIECHSIDVDETGSKSELICSVGTSCLFIEGMCSESVLSFPTRELAIYAGFQFFDIWKDFVFNSQIERSPKSPQSHQ